MNTEVVDVLRRARARIEDPAKWYQGAHRDDSEFSGDDCAVCLDGAVQWAICGYPNAPIKSHDEGRTYWRTIRRLQRTLEVENVSDWNDAPERTHAEVLAAFDRAIELAEAAS